MIQPSQGDENKAGNLELLTVEELERLIQQEMLSEKTADIEYLQRLAEAVNHKQHYPAMDAHQALDMFRSTYLSECKNTITEAEAQSQIKKKQRKYIRILWNAAIVVTLLLALIVVAQAFNINIFNIFGFWTEEKLYYGSQYVQDSDQQIVKLPELTKDQKLSTLQEAFTALNINDQVLPTWQPEGYELESLTVFDEIAGQMRFEAFYQAEDKYYIIDITLYSDITSVNGGFYEKDNTPVEVYALAGHTAYVFSNLDNSVVAWVDGHYKISISGNLEPETLIHISESIYN